ncbi:MAG TPA: hypothetical protein VKD23_00915, partial [Terriglobales bacterium]|nr:hypothetical protein [Terriglobales bacterium]
MKFSRVVACLILVGFRCPQVYGQVVATWTDASGNWSNGANWSTNPAVPNNSGGAYYDVVINGTGSDVITFDASGTVINSLAIGAGETFQDNGLAPTLRVGDPASPGRISVDGTLNWGSGANLILDISAPSTCSPFPCSGGIFTNGFGHGKVNFTNSTLTITDDGNGNTAVLESVNFNNSTMNVSGNLLPHGTTLQNGSIGIVNGQLNMSQAILTIDNSTLTVGSALGGGPNEILLTNGAKFNVAGNFSNDQGGFDVVGGSSAFIGGNFSIGDMPISVDYSTLTVGGSFGNGDSTTRVQNGASLVTGRDFINSGATSALLLSGGSSGTVAGSFTNGSVVAITASILNVNKNFANISGGFLDVSLQNGAVLTVDGTFNNETFPGHNTLRLVGSGNVANIYSLQNSGGIQVDSGSVLNVTGGGFSNAVGGTLTLSGAASVVGGFTNSGGAVILNP